MKLITIAQARDHCKADGADDDAMLTVYADAAEAICARLANRSLFATQAELDAAVAGVAATMATAYANYDAAVEVANGQDDTRIQTMQLAQAQWALDKATVDAEAIIHGIVADADVIDAVLLTTGHLYRNRENVATGTGAAAVEVPMTAQNIMANRRWIGTQL